MGTLHLACWRRPRSERRAQRRGAAAARLVASAAARRCAPGGVRCRCCPRHRQATAAAVARRKTSADANTGTITPADVAPAQTEESQMKDDLVALSTRAQSVRGAVRLQSAAHGFAERALRWRRCGQPTASEVPPERDGGTAAPVPAPPATGASPRRWLGLAAGRHAPLRGAGARPMRPAPLHDAQHNRQLVRRDLCAVGAPNAQ